MQSTAPQTTASKIIIQLSKQVNSLKFKIIIYNNNTLNWVYTEFKSTTSHKSTELLLSYYLNKMRQDSPRAAAQFNNLFAKQENRLIIYQSSKSRNHRD